MSFLAKEMVKMKEAQIREIEEKIRDIKDHQRDRPRTSLNAMLALNELYVRRESLTQQLVEWKSQT